MILRVCTTIENTYSAVPLEKCPRIDLGELIMRLLQVISLSLILKTYTKIQPHQNARCLRINLSQ